MIAVDLGHRYSDMQCAVCHQPLKRCDRVLTSYRHGQPRVMHAHACVAHRVHHTVASTDTPPVVAA